MGEVSTTAPVLYLRIRSPKTGHRDSFLKTPVASFWSCQSFAALGTYLPTGQAVGSWTMLLIPVSRILPGSMMDKLFIHLHPGCVPQFSSDSDLYVALIKAAGSGATGEVLWALLLPHAALTSSSSLITLAWALLKAWSRISICLRWSSLAVRTAANSFSNFSFSFKNSLSGREKTNRASSIRKCLAWGSLAGYIWQGLKIEPCKWQRDAAAAAAWQWWRVSD